MPKPNTPETPAAAPVTPTDDETFASAFDEAVGEDTPNTAAAAPAAVPAAAAEPAEPAAETPAGEPAAEAPSEPAAAEPSEPAPAASAAEEAPEAKIARLEAENASLRAPKPPAPPAPPAAPASAPAGQETPPAAAAAPQPAVEPAWYTPNDDEKAALTDLEKNWPDIATAQQVAIKQAVYNAVQYTFSQIAKTYNPALQRFAELSDVISEQLALSALRGEHEDYDEVYDKVVTWVETLPGPFKAGAKLTMTQGTPEEVAELITEYKRTHTAAPGVATSATPQPAAGKTELSAAAKQAASKLRVVGSKRTTPIAAADPNDFNAAWAEAINTGS